MKEEFHTFMDNLKKTIKRPEMRILPGQLAFFLLLSIIPLFAVIGVVAAKFNLSPEGVLEALSSNVPKEVYDFIKDISKGRSININIVLFYVSTFILASNGPHSMIIGSNLLYNIDHKGWLNGRVKAIIMTIILVILFLFVLLVPAFGDQIVKIITDTIPSNSVDKSIISFYNILKYPISLLIIFFFVKLLYTIAPDKTIKSKNTTVGAMLTTVGWIVATEIYSFYVKDFAGYNLLYGSLSNLIILFLWIYLLSYIFVLGMALNATTYNIDKEDE